VELNPIKVFNDANHTAETEQVGATQPGKNENSFPPEN